MTFVYMIYRCGSRFRQGRIYLVDEDVAAELCDQPGPQTVTGGGAYARRLPDEVGEYIEANDREVDSSGLRPFGELAEFCEELRAAEVPPTPSEKLEAAERRARQARKAAHDIATELEKLKEHAAELEERNAELELRLAELESPAEPIVKLDTDRLAELEELTVPELRELLEAAELDTSGLKAELVERLLEHETQG